MPLEPYSPTGRVPSGSSPNASGDSQQTAPKGPVQDDWVTPLSMEQRESLAAASGGWAGMLDTFSVRPTPDRDLVAITVALIDLLPAEDRGKDSLKKLFRDLELTETDKLAVVRVFRTRAGYVVGRVAAAAAVSGEADS